MKKNLIKCLALAAIPAAGLALASIAVPGVFVAGEGRDDLARRTT